MDVANFVRIIPDFYELKQSEKCLHFAFYNIAVCKKQFFNKDSIESCFKDANIPVYTKVREYLINNSKGRNPNFIKVEGGYSISQYKLDELFKLLKIDKPIIEVEEDLNRLKDEVADANSKDFLEETIKAVEVGSYRASVIMVWILGIDHLYNYIIGCKLDDFNAKLVLQNNKRIKVSKIQNKDDFSDIPEGVFIELCREAKIISNDVRKILEEKLGTRNSCAHPSGIKISKNKAVEFIKDILYNVVFKFTCK
ncbi:hypothetical protein [Hymenobacter cavernae]|uniref:DUF4145 domain-containing protein n=1 Tax=Hymenobacter cavernae TaxID=2044852 RepID=A0ABQ1U4X2_9BACT|nr:hypothetical protein [Hymenobacter cavernae]GGF09636.1 hypothetical protein GCM10011383_21040 [Hymenobacter cavernae]